jgi:trans-aconitate 2-methyltransferase
MPWNPEVYNQFKSIRYKPFFDLANLLDEVNMHRCVDVGCGTGEQTRILSERFKDAHFLGIDSSEEMLKESKQFTNKNLSFNKLTIEQFADNDTTWDLIFSNAALQWSDNHEVLFPKLISKLKNGGQLAIQMPFQKENILNKLLHELVTKDPFKEMLDGFVRNSPLLEIDDYANILFKAGLSDINISLKVYPIIAENELDLYNFISGSALIPYMEKLDAKRQELLKEEFTKRIRNNFKTFPAIYSFKRLLMYGIKK